MADEGATTEAPEAPNAALDPSAAGLSESATELLAALEAELGDAMIEWGSAFGDLVVRVEPRAWLATARFANESLHCDYLSFIAGLDWMVRPSEERHGTGEPPSPAQPDETSYGVAGSAGRFQVFARVSSTSRHWGVTVKVDVDSEEPRVDSWNDVYPGADWHERECWEMYGFVFDGHPSLRHLYLPSEFEGHPLRKDFALLAREVKPWPGIVDVEDMPEAADSAGDSAGDTSGDEVGS